MGTYGSEGHLGEMRASFTVSQRMTVREGRSTKQPLQGQPNERCEDSDEDLRPEEERSDPGNPRAAGQYGQKGE